MKTKTTLFLLCIIVISSCTRGNFYEHQRLSALPSAAHDRPIDVYFENEAQPAKDYVEFYDLRIVKRGVFNDRQMVEYLKAEAQKKGLDGIADLRKWDETEETVSLLDAIATITDDTGFEYTTINNYSIIEGKGIKYVENIDLSQSIKTGKVTQVSTGQEVGQINYLPNGLINETLSETEDAKLLMDAFFKLSEDYLLHEEKGWQTLHHADGRIDVRRKYRMNDWILAKARVKYDPDRKRIKAIRLVEDPKRDEMITKLIYSYDQSGRIISRNAEGDLPMKQKLVYSTDKPAKLTGLELQFGGSTYRVDFSYYQQSDLSSLIKKVDVVE